METVTYGNKHQDSDPYTNQPFWNWHSKTPFIVSQMVYQFLPFINSADKINVIVWYSVVGLCILYSLSLLPQTMFCLSLLLFRSHRLGKRELSRLVTKPTKWMCAQRSLRSAWASVQSDQSLRCPHEESLDPKLPTECTAKALIRLGGCSGWFESSLGHSHFVGFVMRRLIFIDILIALQRNFADWKREGFGL